MVDCPFCRFPCSTTNPGQWCAGCYVRWRLTPAFVIFDPAMKARSFGEALAVALAKSGGARLGSA